MGQEKNPQGGCSVHFVKNWKDRGVSYTDSLNIWSDEKAQLYPVCNREWKRGNNYC